MHNTSPIISAQLIIESILKKTMDTPSNIDWDKTIALANRNLNAHNPPLHSLTECETPKDQTSDTIQFNQYRNDDISIAQRHENGDYAQELSFASLREDNQILPNGTPTEWIHKGATEIVCSPEEIHVAFSERTRLSDDPLTTLKKDSNRQQVILTPVTPRALTLVHDTEFEEHIIEYNWAELALLQSLIGSKPSWLAEFTTGKNHYTHPQEQFNVYTSYDVLNYRSFGSATIRGEKSSLVELFGHLKRTHHSQTIRLIKDSFYPSSKTPHGKKKLSNQILSLCGYTAAQKCNLTFDKYGRHCGSTFARLNTPFSYYVVHSTSWKLKDTLLPVELMLPYQNKCILSNTEVPFNYHKPIILTPNFLLMQDNCESQNYHWLSWWGDINNVDFHNLKRKDIFLLLDATTANVKKEATPILKALNKQGVKTTGILRISSLSTAKRELTCDFIPISYFEKKEQTHRPSKLKCLKIPVNNLSQEHRSNYLEPVLIHPSITMLYAKTGIGKTWLALTLGLACAAGTSPIPGWNAPNPMNVIYVDGENGHEELASRFSKLITLHPAARNSFYYLSSSEIDIANEEHQAELESIISTKSSSTNLKHSLIILDNLSALTKHNDSTKIWEKVSSWLMRLKEQGISSIIIHHTNKQGSQRGSVLKEYLLDTSIKLSPTPTDDSIMVEIKKSRSIPCSACPPFNIKYIEDNGLIKWTKCIPQLAKEDRNAQIVSLSKKGYKEEDIAKTVGCSLSTVKRIRKQEGLTKVRQNKNRMAQ